MLVLEACINNNNNNKTKQKKKTLITYHATGKFSRRQTDEFFFVENKIRHFMQIRIVKSYILGKYLKMSSAEFSTQHAKCLGLYVLSLATRH